MLRLVDKFQQTGYDFQLNFLAKIIHEYAFCDFDDGILFQNQLNQRSLNSGQEIAVKVATLDLDRSVVFHQSLPDSLHYLWLGDYFLSYVTVIDGNNVNEDIYHVAPDMHVFAVQGQNQSLYDAVLVKVGKTLIL